ncbi:MAG: exonuclease domain-containing protein [Isosphaeraceae bacterium]|nr:exonuclease domain-containing protein [Isosphaeraceae bacterium]
MRQLQDYIAFDLETTGLVAETDRVVEIGAVRFDAAGRETGRFESLVFPDRRMAPAAQAIHGISDGMLADAPSARVVLPAFLAFLGPPDSTALIAHNAGFDAGFLGRELRRAGLAIPDHAVIDTLALARRKLPELRDHRLDTLARLYRLDPNGTHRALADCLRVKGLWLALEGPAEPVERLVSYPIAAPSRSALVPNGWDGLAEAVARGLRVRMEYEGGSRGSQPREITPVSFVHRGGVAYVVAFCHIDSFEKSFRLDRVRRYEIVTVETSCP